MIKCLFDRLNVIATTIAYWLILNHFYLFWIMPLDFNWYLMTRRLITGEHDSMQKFFNIRWCIIYVFIDLRFPLTWICFVNVSVFCLKHKWVCLIPHQVSFGLREEELSLDKLKHLMSKEVDNIHLVIYPITGLALQSIHLPSFATEKQPTTKLEWSRLLSFKLF